MKYDYSFPWLKEMHHEYGYTSNFFTSARFKPNEEFTEALWQAIKSPLLPKKIREEYKHGDAYKFRTLSRMVVTYHSYSMQYPQRCNNEPLHGISFALYQYARNHFYKKRDSRGIKRWIEHHAPILKETSFIDTVKLIQHFK